MTLIFISFTTTATSTKLAITKTAEKSPSPSDDKIVGSQTGHSNALISGKEFINYVITYVTQAPHFWV